MRVVVWGIVMFFFFSSRRRHTRLVSDWSSDVCSSDLSMKSNLGIRRGTAIALLLERNPRGALNLESVARKFRLTRRERRSEERRVGKEWRDGGWRKPYKNEKRMTADARAAEGVDSDTP